jgi:hypothetical protein
MPHRSSPKEQDDSFRNTADTWYWSATIFFLRICPILIIVFIAVFDLYCNLNINVTQYTKEPYKWFEWRDYQFYFIFFSFFFLLFVSGCLLRILTISNRINPFSDLVKKAENQDILNKTKKISTCYIIAGILYSLFFILAKYLDIPTG